MVALARATDDAGFDVMARIVEVVSGMPFDQFTKTRIFDPLGMKDTFFYPAEGADAVAFLDAQLGGAAHDRRAARERGRDEQRGELVDHVRCEFAVHFDAVQLRVSHDQIRHGLAALGTITLGRATA